MLSRLSNEREARFHDDTNYGAVFICSKYIDILGKKKFALENSRESIGTIGIYRLSCTHRDQFVISVIGFYDLTASGHW